MGGLLRVGCRSPSVLGSRQRTERCRLRHREPHEARGRQGPRRLQAGRLPERRGAAMSGGFTKLFNSIIGSTIWQENPATKVVWITMLTMRDKGGVVEASVPGLAKLSGVSIEEAEVALTKFLAPDPYSSSPEHEGRRIERVEGGWRILNHYKYQEKMSKDDIRERDRIRQQQYREQKKCRAKGVTKCDNRDTSRQSRHKDLDVPQPLNVENPNPLAHSENERGVVDPSNGSLIDTSKSKKVTTANRAMLVEDLYSRYPRKVGKANAHKVI